MDLHLRNSSLPNLSAASSMELNRPLLLKPVRKSSSHARSSSCLKVGNRQPSPLSEKKQTPLMNGQLPINLKAADLLGNGRYSLRTDSSHFKPFLDQNASQSARKRDDLCASQIREKSKAYYKNLTEKVIDLKNMFFDYYRGDDMPLLPKRVHVNRVVECLELLKRDESEQHELMTIIIKMLKATLYVNHDVAVELAKGIQFLGETDLTPVLKSCQQESIPYYTLCFAVFKEIAKQGQRLEEIKKEHELKTEDLNQVILGKDKQIEEYIQKFSRCVSYEVFENTLQEKDSILKQWEDICEVNKTLKNQQKEYEANITDLKNKIEQGAQEMRDYIDRTAEIVEANEIFTKDIEDYKHLLNEAKNKVKNYKNTMDSVIIKVSDMKQQISNLIKINDQLSFENEKLKLRAAIAFEQLTPRPHYKKLQKEKKIELDIYDEKKNQIVSTSEIVEGLLDKISKIEIDQNNAEMGKEKLNNNGTSEVPEISNLGKHMDELAKGRRASKEGFKKRSQTAWPKFDPETGEPLPDALKEFGPFEGNEGLENKSDLHMHKIIEENEDPKELPQPEPKKQRQSTLMRKTQSFAFKVKNLGDETTRAFGREALKGVNDIIAKVVNTKKKM